MKKRHGFFALLVTLFAALALTLTACSSAVRYSAYPLSNQPSTAPLAATSTASRTAKNTSQTTAPSTAPHTSPTFRYRGRSFADLAIWRAFMASMDSPEAIVKTFEIMQQRNDRETPQELAKSFSAVLHTRSFPIPQLPSGCTIVSIKTEVLGYTAFEIQLPDNARVHLQIGHNEADASQSDAPKGSYPFTTANGTAGYRIETEGIRTSWRWLEGDARAWCRVYCDETEDALRQSCETFVRALTFEKAAVTGQPAPALPENPDWDRDEIVGHLTL